MNQPLTELGLFFKTFFKSLFNIKSEVDYLNAKAKIEAGIVFKGFNVWVLICSIFIASIGLNANSTAVIIGAMLISPLMGPIVGAGFAIGTNDVELLKKTIFNFGIMIAVSLLTSYLYFKLTPIDDAGTEIIARTEPILLDVFIAILGGLAGIIAITRKEISNVLPGVAIATALMPPLCTAGYGLAIGNYSYFFGAIYLFILNSMFIALSTMLFIRSIDFPRVNLWHERREKKIRWGLFIAVILIILPSIYVFYRLIVNANFEKKTEQFVKEMIHYQGTYILAKNKDLKTQKLTLILAGKTVPTDILQLWEDQFIQRFPKAGLQIIQNEIAISSTPEQKKTFNLDLSEQVFLLFPQIKKIAFAPVIYYQDKKLIQEETFFVTLRPNQVLSTVEQERLKAWLEKNLQIDFLHMKYE